MRPSQKQALRALYEFCCGYCGVGEAQVGAELTVDHFQPRSRGGTDENENLVYACHACNEFKSDFWPDEEQVRLLHPRRDDLAFHLATADDGALQGLTPEGELFVERLRLNRAPLVERRRALVRQRFLEEERQVLLQQLAALEQQVQRLSDELETV